MPISGSWNLAHPTRTLTADLSNVNVLVAGDIDVNGFTDTIVQYHFAEGDVDSFLLFNDAAFDVRNFTLDQLQQAGRALYVDDLLTPAGDVNGDGIADLLVAYRGSNAAFSASAGVLFGNPVRGNINLSRPAVALAHTDRTRQTTGLESAYPVAAIGNLRGPSGDAATDFAIAEPQGGSTLVFTSLLNPTPVAPINPGSTIDPTSEQDLYRLAMATQRPTLTQQTDVVNFTDPISFARHASRTDWQRDQRTINGRTIDRRRQRRPVGRFSVRWADEKLHRVRTDDDRRDNVDCRRGQCDPRSHCAWQARRSVRRCQCRRHQRHRRGQWRKRLRDLWWFVAGSPTGACQRQQDDHDRLHRMPRRFTCLNWNGDANADILTVPASGKSYFFSGQTVTRPNRLADRQ